MIIQYKRFGCNEWEEVEVDMFKYGSGDFTITGILHDCNGFTIVPGVSDVSVKLYKHNFNKDGDN